ncbi:hypothetical protein V7S43_002499 [Phytophthora oleae]|uniref:Cyclin N-terminal domain-containing protein n=1 Tax=Phytophthora oleae TaxID=2107226 RepID=A0ABD3G196_9STRA
MSFTRRSVRINNENEMPADLASSRLGKRHILRDVKDAGNPEKRQRFMKSESTATVKGESSTTSRARRVLGDMTNRRSALGDVTNRINIKKASMSSMSSSVSNAGALAKKKALATKRSLSNINIGSRSLNTANTTKRAFSNVNLSSRHASSTTSTVSINSRSSSSIISRMSRPLPSSAPAASTIGSLGLFTKTSTKVEIIPEYSDEEDYDIDSEDKNDPTACWQYAEDITKYHLQVEKKRKTIGTYMGHQIDINAKMRAILVDWLVDVHYKYGLLPQTLHIAVLLIDHFLEKGVSVDRQRLQLVGISAMFIASKYEEIYPPEAKDFVKITDNAYTREQVFEMEAKMLAAIGYRVTFPTAFQFMKRFVKASRTCDDRVEHFAHYIIDRTLQEYKLMKYRPSMIAASAVHIARTQMGDSPAWSPTLEHHSSYSESDLSSSIKELKEMLWNTHNKVGKMANKLTAARRKFSKERFMGVANGPLAFGKDA